MEKSPEAFIERHVNEIRPVVRDFCSISWEYDTSGDERLADKKRSLAKKYFEIYANAEDFELTKKFLDSENIKDPIIRRQLEHMHNAFALYQGSKGQIDRIVQLETEVTGIFNHFRGKINGQPLNDNQIKTILRKEVDNDKRRLAWEASKQVGQQVADKVIELVKIRNERAREAGYSDYYSMALKTKELDEEKMFATLDELGRLTEQPFCEFKEQLDAEKAEIFQVSPEKLRPWHYGDPFFQELPPRKSMEVDHFFEEVNLEEVTVQTFDSIGMETREILANSDLYPKEGKCQHAYCMHVDREARDIRILCNLDNTEKWTSTMLHEFGHAVYDLYIDRKLPFLLQEPAHTLSTEAIAMMMDTLSKSPKWLKDVANVDPQEVDKMRENLLESERQGQFVFVRWGLVMVNFERQLYQNPDQDLNSLWWDLVEKYQKVTRPEGRNQPDWAAKIHLALCPVYYQNYIYGELVAAQLIDHIRSQVGTGELFNNPDLGEYLTEKYFKSGSLYNWNTTLKNATEQDLDPKYYVKQTLKIDLN